MSSAGELAARVPKLLAEGRIVPVAEQMRLGYVAQHEERTLPLEEITRRILKREDETPTRAG
jgi:hypothetical protein